MNFARRGKKGFTLVETAIAATIFIMVAGAIFFMIHAVNKSMVNSRQRFSGNRLLQTALSRYKNIDFFYILPADSAQANYGITGDFEEIAENGTNIRFSAVYPYTKVLDDILTDIKSAGFDRFTSSVTYWRRDSSGVTGNPYGMIVYIDTSPADGIDDYDPNIRYTQKNDVDFNDIFMFGGQRQSEVPSTLIRQLTITLYKNNIPLQTQSEFINYGQLSGDPAKSLDLSLKIYIASPTIVTTLYDMSAGPQFSAFTLLISCSYPSNIYFARADSISPLVIKGSGPPPFSDILVAVNSFVVDAGTAAVDGTFAFSSLPATAALLEGRNSIRFQARKDIMHSPFAFRNLIYDKRPPLFSATKPTGATVTTKTPYVGVTLLDDTTSTTAVSGIALQTIALLVNGVSQNFRYNEATGQLRWVVSNSASSPNYLTPTLANGSTYNVWTEAGDRAGFKVKQATWTFIVNVPGDAVQPDINSCFPSGTSPTKTPDMGAVISDSTTGIDPSTIIADLDGTVVVNSANVGKYYDLFDNKLTYRPANALSSGSHTLTITAKDWANNSRTYGCTSFTTP